MTDTTPVAQSEALPAGSVPPTKKKTDWWAEIRGFLWLVLAVLGFHSLVAKPFYIPSESMMPGLLVGDQLIVTKYPYGWSYISPTFHVLPFIHGRLFGHLPERGDVVIASPPDSREDYIKRVVGIPGDTVAVHEGKLILNGKPVAAQDLGYRMIPVDGNTRCDPTFYPGALTTGANGKPYCRLHVIRETMPEQDVAGAAGNRSYDTIDLGPSEGDEFPATKVPAGHVFLMGDNRDNSADSRFSLAQNGLGGPVPWENLGGRAEFITFSLNGNASWNPLSWFGDFRGGRAGTSLHPAHGG